MQSITFTFKKAVIHCTLFAALGIVPVTFTACGNARNEETVAMHDESGIPALLDRKGELAKAMEWEKTKEKVAELKQKIQHSPADIRPRLQLATIYMSEARVTANPYYYQASLKILDGVLAIDAQSFEAYTYKASVAMSLHRFAEAKQLAERARSINPDNAYVCGVLVDANVELGNYAEAIAMSDKMQMLKPSLEAYSRASYLREIFGDYTGAEKAMLLAVQAGAQGSESAEWARVTLGDIYLSTGRIEQAQKMYQTALMLRPNFTNAEIGLAKVEKARKNYDQAIKYTEDAIRVISEASYVALLGDLYELKGDDKKAGEIRASVIGLLEDGEKNNDSDVYLKHNAARELAQAYLSNKNYDKALTHALEDLQLRPANIDANELVAWIYYMRKDYANARTYADRMLATNTKNANTLYKAGTIYLHSGDVEKGNALIQSATNVNPVIDQRIILASK